ncbi:phosphate ABC transporter, inner membrane subunit PstA [mine drainage metagenome]|uniref:Phosphate ABC transporter, inner membrane subunit PstA n=1 Tax=mine drainage metagenome TaxID=410659 RepID=T1AG80_9ZZZZ
MTPEPTPSPRPDDGRELVRSSGRLRRRLIFDRAIGWVLLAAFAVVLLPLFDMIYWVSANALPTFSWATLTENQVGTGGGLYPMIQGTLVIIAVATALATGLGVAAGFYTSEYAPPPIARLARTAGNLLAGVPAIVLGYFGYFLLVIYTGWGFTALGGAITLGIFMTPYVYRTTDVALSSVPTGQREAALALGARPHQYLGRVAFRIALPTVLTGVFFAMALGLGEAAPLYYTAGFNSYPIGNLMSPTGTLSVAIYQFYENPPSFGHFLDLAFQAAFLSIVIVLALNVAVQLLSDRYRRRLRGLYQ